MTHTTPEESRHHRAHVLVVDDERSARTGLEKLLSSEGYRVSTAGDGAAALELALDAPPDIVITDLKMPGVDGIELLGRLRRTMPDIPVLVVTAFGEVTTAVSAMRAGAEDYLTKPIDFDALLVTVERALERRNLRAEAHLLREQLRENAGAGLGGLVGASPPMQSVYATVRRIAGSRATVLITGESGTGKGEVARAIHRLSDRAKGPFVTLQCAALAENLLESELFGHEKGAFTGADRRRVGRVEQARGGTLFLDEIGEIPPALQVKLLRVLQERSFERVGGNETIEVDVRIVAATNRDLAAEVKKGRFREDLYYRLHVIHLEMPPLRVRGTDVLVLAQHFIAKFAEENRKEVHGLDDEARARVLSHAWPGNVRELENAMERAVVMAESDRVTVRDLPPELQPAPDLVGIRIPGSTMADIERHAILRTLESVQGSTKKAADVLRISVRTIQYRLAEYGIRARN